MPKRSYPFGDTNPMQFKTHVGVKELAAGSAQDELMKDVYDKTYQKLFLGSSLYGSADINDNHMTSAVLSMPDFTTRFEPTQSLIDTSGHLQSPFRPAMGRKKFDENSHQSVPTSVNNRTFEPPLPGQRCLNFRGQLTTRSEIEIDCGMDVESGGHEGGDKDCSSTKILENGAGASGCTSSGSILQRLGFSSGKAPSTRVPSSIHVSPVCQTCRRMPGHIRCQFCEKAMCVGCLRQCDSCADSFCQLCSVINYDIAVERAFCLNCCG